MSAWDWSTVGEIVVGVTVGIALGGYILIGFARGLAYELLAHPVTRQLANAADQITGKGGGGGLLTKGASMLEGLLGLGGENK